jgi:hypothetical protein
MTRYPTFDRRQLWIREISARGHQLTADKCWRLDQPFERFCHSEFGEFITAVQAARRHDRPVILMMGAHPIKLGLSRFVIDLMARGILTHVATNGAGIIHDFELALTGGTSESVPHWIREGQFGLWHETGRLNDVIRQAAENNEGIGEAVGRTIVQNQFPMSEISIAAAGWRHRIPVTSHVSIGSDIIHSHPNCDGASLGRASMTDFLILAAAIQKLEGGVFINLGTAVTGPEVYLKALSMARNVERQAGRSLNKFTTAVFDLVELPAGYRHGPPHHEHAQYYYRPWKTILVRTVSDGGRSYYFQGDHRQTLPSIWQAMTLVAVDEPSSKSNAA